MGGTEGVSLSGVITLLLFDVLSRGKNEDEESEELKNKNIGMNETNNGVERNQGSHRVKECTSVRGRKHESERG